METDIYCEEHSEACYYNLFFHVVVPALGFSTYQYSPIFPFLVLFLCFLLSLNTIATMSRCYQRNFAARLSRDGLLLEVIWRVFIFIFGTYFLYSDDIDTISLENSHMRFDFEFNSTLELFYLASAVNKDDGTHFNLNHEV